MTSLTFTPNVSIPFAKLLLLGLASLLFAGVLLPIGISYVDPRIIIDYWMVVPLVALIVTVLLRNHRWHFTLLYFLFALLLAFGVNQLGLQAVQQFEMEHGSIAGYSYPTTIVRQFQPGTSREQVHVRFQELGRVTFSGYPPDRGPTYSGDYGESIYFQVSLLTPPIWFVVAYDSKHQLKRISWVD